ncbi:MAG: hypothetical protein LQ340_001657 [Diploschistes diacapsis]|nr:MAG: hypothetical protein LQ340_001657 [Diploschistes diacapsis]
MLGGTIIPDWSTVFTGALFALTIAICCHALFWRPQKKKSTSIPEKTLIPKKTLILRIEEIPAGIPHETLQHDLESIVYQNPILRKDEITVLQASFVPIDRKTACATAAFHTSLKPADLIKLCQAHIGLPYRFDNKFDGITPLYEASGGADVDVIAVPGLGSHAIGSWKSPSGDDLWLRDYLPRDIPNIRVLLYGYDTSLLGGDCKDSIEDLGIRFLESVKAFRADTLKSIVEGQPNELLIHDLVVDSDSEPTPFLKRISRQFSNYYKGQYQVISFFERKKSPTVKFQPDGQLTKTGPMIFMVTQESATSTGLTAAGGENNIPLNTDHSGLVKYQSRSQEEYKIVKSKLSILVDEAKQEVCRRFTEKGLTDEESHLWLNLNRPPYSAFRYSSKLARPEKGTLEWLVQEKHANDNSELRANSMPEGSLCMKDFKSWRDSKESEILLISASPGRGKSVLSNFVLGHLERKIQEEPSPRSKVIYYFCNIRNDDASPNACSVLQALIVQLCEDYQRLFRILPSDYQKVSDRFFSDSFDTLWYTFEKMLQNDTYARVFCIIDGLDVYQEMGELITKLNKAFSPRTEAKSRVLKLFCTTRPSKPILELLKPSKPKILRCNEDDLAIFIESRVSSLEETFGAEIIQSIKDQLNEKAENTFLWLEVVTRGIRSIEMPTPSKIKDTIEDNPEELNDLYHLLVNSLVKKDKDKARLLAWVVYARSPLDLRALEDAMAIDLTKTYTSYEQCNPDKPSLKSETFHNVFGTLFDIVEDKVYCIHQSLKDYFESRNPLEEFLDRKHPRLVLAHVSMAYLSLEEFGHPSRDMNMLLHKFPLLRYAANHWYSHIESAADITCSPPLQDFLKEIIPPNNLKTQVWMSEHVSKIYPNYPSRISEVAIYFDIGWLAELLLNREPCGISDDFERNCLSQAMTRQGAVLEVLLKHERVLALTVTGGEVRFIARFQHFRMMKLLLDRRGTDVQITEEVVEAAARNDKNGREIMTLLLDRRGADVQITEKVVVAAAGSWGSGKDVMTLLLDRRGADVQITEKVAVAAAGNNESGKDVMTLLLDRRGADVQITKEVVVAAAENFWNAKDVMTLLLDRRGADVQITEKVVVAAAGNYWNAKDVMILLLDRRGADVQITEKVVVAAAGNSKDSMTLLLDRRGADVQITEKVVVAAAGNHESGRAIMALLLDRRGADVQITEKVEVAAAGSWGSGKDVMTLLLDRRGADVEIAKEAVKVIAEHFDEEVITLLPEQQGADA